MNNFFCRLAPVVALGLPLLAPAQSRPPDPVDPKALAPALRYLSAFADYTRWQDIKTGDWRALNDALRDDGAAAGQEAPAMPLAAPPAARSPAPTVSLPAASAHGGHHPQGDAR
ncbi:hypothetical protein LRH25_30860 [Ideonella azotifigens]|uniref:Uncharacterized protein n=1 Tax=Ideonella azotifigens TaxID=513160 RepID=A0ABP3UNJ8_9BURK|nr:hypothetical protein [Ideonella azotifigens]MCD2344725.1 hypothetical protein [Ideonella azotifigens]